MYHKGSGGWMIIKMTHKHTYSKGGSAMIGERIRKKENKMYSVTAKGRHTK